MRIIGVEELKQLQLEILLKVHEFCGKNDLDYFLGYGSLIGAIRHKGYIPWDDDIDIGMPRPSYEKFLSSFNGTYPNLEVMAPELNWDFYAPYANVFDNRTFLNEGANSHRGIDIGIKIDIFPIDGVPPQKPLYRLMRFFSWMYNKILEIKRYELPHDGNYKRLIESAFLKALLYPIKYSFIQKKIYSMSQKNSFESSIYVDKITFLNKGLTRMPRQDFEEYIDIEFEGHLFKTIKNYDTYLRKIYGDYMKLPPIEQRVPMHNFEAWWK